MKNRTREEKRRISLTLDYLSLLRDDMISRNPRVRALQEKFPRLGITHDSEMWILYETELEKTCQEIWGDGFPTHPYIPAQGVKDRELTHQQSHELVLKIDLRCSKDDILFQVERAVTLAVQRYRNIQPQRKETKWDQSLYSKEEIEVLKSLTEPLKPEAKLPKNERKRTDKWVEYLRIWDLKCGSPEWYILCHRKIFIDEKDRLKPWTYEQIAKHLYPDAQAPEELRRAIEKVKKQYRAACRLICGKTYDLKLINNKTRKAGYHSDFPCTTCQDRHCDNHNKPTYACPQVIIYFEKFDTKQQHLLVSNLSGIEIVKYKKTRKRLPNADDQLRRLR